MQEWEIGAWVEDQITKEQEREAEEEKFCDGLKQLCKRYNVKIEETNGKLYFATGYWRVSIEDIKSSM